MLLAFADLHTAPLVAFGQALPKLKGCLGYFIKLTAMAGRSSLRAVVDTNRYVELVCNSLARSLSCLGSEHAIQQLTSNQAAAVDVLNVCLDAVFGAYKSSADRAHVASAIQVSGEL